KEIQTAWASDRTGPDLNELETILDLSLIEEDVGDTEFVVRAKPTVHVRMAQVEVEQHHALAGHGHGERQVGDRRCFAFACVRAGDDDSGPLEITERNTEARPEDPESLGACRVSRPTVSQFGPTSGHVSAVW